MSKPPATVEFRPFSILSFHSLAGFFLMALSAAPVLAEPPLSLHPDNPHYFLFRGKPTVLITSGEHYGAVLNLDFDYVRYLRTLARDGLNGTRTWAGAYCEPPDAFSIRSNTLAPLPGRFISPWTRGNQPGYVNGGNKFDLSQWDPAYFKRLKDFMSEANKRGVIVEMNLFCPFYEESMWRLSPMNAINNINGIGTVARTNVYTLDRNGGLLVVQQAMVRKMVKELKDFPNLYYEICNEPYFGGVTLEWQREIANTIAEAESALGVRHLISQNIANGSARIENPDPHVSIFNFHYATPPETVALNYQLEKVIGDNETGFRGTNDSAYRMEGWDFLTAGGGLFNNLDYSFVAGQEDGTFVFPASLPGGGSPVLRRQFHMLGKVMNELAFVRMHPDKSLTRAEPPQGVGLRTLAEPGKQYLVYLRTVPGDPKKQVASETHFAAGALTLELSLPPGRYRVEWFSPLKGASLRQERVEPAKGTLRLACPEFDEDLAVVIKAG